MANTPPPPGGFEPPAPNYNNPTGPPEGAGYEPLPGLPYEPPPGYGATPPPPPPTPGTASAERAGFGSRLLSAFIDGLVTGVPFWAITAILATQLPKREGIWFCERTNGDIERCEPLTSGGQAILLISLGVMTLLIAAYYAWFEGKRGATIGKRAAGIKVVDHRSGEPIGVARGVGRYFGRILSAIPLFLGFLWNIWDKDKQTWHDKMTNSAVVRNN